MEFQLVGKKNYDVWYNWKGNQLAKTNSKDLNT
jgi:hypothetical protein